MKIKSWGLAVSWGLFALACSSSNTDSNKGGGASVNDANLCEEQFDATNVKCPLSAESKAGNVQACLADQQDFDSIGCKPQYDSWLACTTTPGYDCTTDTGCEASQGSYFGCQSQATIRTGCVHLGGQDTTRCTDASKPYAFSCTGAGPTQCVQVVTSGAGIWCCPQL